MPDAQCIAQCITDARGDLYVVESGREVPFPVRRVFWLDRLSPQHDRGFHAHRCCREVVFCLRGQCELVLDDGKNRRAVKMDKPARGVFVDRMIWVEMRNFSEDCLLLVLADDHYDEADFIRDYDEFLTAAGGGSSESQTGGAV